MSAVQAFREHGSCRPLVGAVRVLDEARLGLLVVDEAPTAYTLVRGPKVLASGRGARRVERDAVLVDVRGAVPQLLVDLEIQQEVPFGLTEQPELVVAQTGAAVKSESARLEERTCIGIRSVRSVGRREGGAHFVLVLVLTRRATKAIKPLGKNLPFK